MSALGRDVLKSRLGGLPPMPPASIGTGTKKRQLLKKRDYTPVHWDEYFQHKHDVNVGENVFRVYETGTEGPVLFFIHGGGFSALSWSLLCSGLSHLVTCRCAALDMRGHGDTITTNDVDLSAETLSKDVGDVIQQLYGEDPPPIILVGHSMGGAIAVHTTEQNLVPSLIGLVVIDVVEGTALDALSSMQSFLRGRPKTFKSLEHAIEWCVRSGQIRNLDSARVSMVGQLKRLDNEETATSMLEHEPEGMLPPGLGQSIAEEPEDEQTKQTESNSQPQSNADHFKEPGSSSTGTNTQYTWRIDLGKTEKFWRGWFEGLSKRFLSCDVPKMLLLAGVYGVLLKDTLYSEIRSQSSNPDVSMLTVTATGALLVGVDRLDKDLTIGQMQGKFQMQVLPQSGHAVHEDVPDKVADVLATFMVRHRVAEATSNFQRPSTKHPKKWSVGYRRYTVCTVCLNQGGWSFPAC